MFGRIEMKDILIVTLSNIGDVVLTTPVIASVACAHPEARLTVVCGPKGAGVLEQSQTIDQVVIYDKKASLMDKLKFLSKLREHSYDLVIDLRNTAIPFLVRSRKSRVFFRKPTVLSMRKKHLAVLEAMGIKPLENAQFDFFQFQDALSIKQKLSLKGLKENNPFILISPFAASSLKTWSYEKYKMLIQNLLSVRPEFIVLAGEEKVRDQMADFVSVNPQRVFNMAGETNLPELAALIDLSSLVVANDSSMIHFGYELKKPVVALFGPTNHHQYGHQGAFFRIVREDVSCSRCHLAECRHESQASMENLSVLSVLNACLDLLNQNKTQSQNA